MVVLQLFKKKLASRLDMRCGSFASKLHPEKMGKQNLLPRRYKLVFLGGFFAPIKLASGRFLELSKLCFRSNLNFSCVI